METLLTFDCQLTYRSGFKLDAKFDTSAQVTALLGPSGSGKTTIVSLIAGLLKPDSGTIRLDDRVLTETKANVFLSPEHRHVGLMFQDHCLFPHMSVRANVAYGTRRRSTKGISIARVVETLELSEFMDRYPRSLSGGQQQRVALARAIVSAPRILLLDEPLTSVETSLRDRIATFVERAVHEFKLPTLLVTHNRDLVDRIATQIVTIENGRVASIQSV